MDEVQGDAMNEEERVTRIRSKLARRSIIHLTMVFRRRASRCRATQFNPGKNHNSAVESTKIITIMTQLQSVAHGLVTKSLKC